MHDHLNKPIVFRLIADLEILYPDESKRATIVQQESTALQDILWVVDFILKKG
jgi:hypothetical protein